MPARIRRKSLSAIAHEGFLDRRSKRCFWLLLSPQTKVARAGARNYPRRRQRKRSRRGAKLSPAETNNALTPLRRRHLIRPLRGYLSPCGSVRGSDTPPACHSIPRTHQGGRLGGVRHSRGRLGGGGGRSEKRLPWLRQAAASASAPVNAGTVLLTDNGDERLCPREYAGNHSRP